VRIRRGLFEALSPSISKSDDNISALKRYPDKPLKGTASVREVFVKLSSVHVEDHWNSKHLRHPDQETFADEAPAL
jgi:hypothetical protein